MDGSSDMSQVPVATEVNLKTFKLLSCFLLLDLRLNSLFLVVQVSCCYCPCSLSFKRLVVSLSCVLEH